MAKKKKELTDTELDSLDEYLQYEFNHDIYQELTNTDGDYFELFEPLEFFRVLYLTMVRTESCGDCAICSEIVVVGMVFYQRRL